MEEALPEEIERKVPAGEEEEGDLRLAEEGNGRPTSRWQVFGLSLES